MAIFENIIKIFLITFLLASQVQGQAVINKPKSISFNKPLQAGGLTSDFDDAKSLFSGLFYISLCIGVIKVVKTAVETPEKTKKVITNWLVGLFIFGIIYNLVG